MSPMPTATPMTAQEYLACHHHDGLRSELIDGEVVVNEPCLRHQAVCDELQFALTSWTRAAAGRGFAVRPLDVLLDELNVFAPDVLWYAEGRVPPRTDPRPYPMPDLAVEVRSPSTWRYDVGAKKSGYERHGLPELWLVDLAAAEVLIFRRAGRRSAGFDVALELARGDELASPMLPGFSLALRALFDG